MPSIAPKKYFEGDFDPDMDPDYVSEKPRHIGWYDGAFFLDPEHYPPEDAELDPPLHMRKGGSSTAQGGRSVSWTAPDDFNSTDIFKRYGWMPPKDTKPPPASWLKREEELKHENEKEPWWQKILDRPDYPINAQREKELRDRAERETEERHKIDEKITDSSSTAFASCSISSNRRLHTMASQHSTIPLDLVTLPVLLSLFLLPFVFIFIPRRRTKK